jgi:glycosyltransferase involved in cell wall biosynthesis
VESESVEAFAAAAERLFRDRALAQRLGRRGRERVVARFNTKVKSDAIVSRLGIRR